MFSKIKSLMSKEEQEQEIVKDEMERDAFIQEEEPCVEVIERIINDFGRSKKVKGVMYGDIFYPLKHGFEFTDYKYVTRVYKYLDLHNKKQSVHLITNDKDKYMKDEKYIYVGVVWKYIETFEPNSKKSLKNNYWENYNDKYGKQTMISNLWTSEIR